LPPVIVDECVSSRMVSYLLLRGQTQVTCIRDGSSDNYIKRMARDKDAYIITRDRDFLDYQKALIVDAGDSVKFVYEQLLNLFNQNQRQNHNADETREFSR